MMGAACVLQTGARIKTLETPRRPDRLLVVAKATTDENITTNIGRYNLVYILYQGTGRKILEEYRFLQNIKKRKK